MSIARKRRRIPEVKPEELPWPAVIPISGINPESHPEKLKKGEDIDA